MNTTHWSHALLTALILCSSIAVHAQVYECRDSQGRHLYTEQPSNSHCKAVNVRNTGTFSSMPAYTPVATADSSDDNTDNHSKPQPSKQLQTAQQQLNEARSALAEGKKVRNGNERNYAKYLERIKGLEDNVKQREQAVQQLKQQDNDK